MNKDNKESTIKKIGSFVFGAVVVYLLVQIFGWVLSKILTLFL